MRRRGRWIALAIGDGAAWVAGLVIATFARFEFDLTQIDGSGLATISLAGLIVLWPLGLVTKMYRGRYPAGSRDDAVNVSRVLAVVGAAALAADSVGPMPPLPRSVPPTAALLTMALCVAARLFVRYLRERRDRPDRGSARQVIVYGAGTRGRQLVLSMLSGGAGGYFPLALLDDDPMLRYRRIAGVAVRGTGADLAAVAGQTGAELLVIAMSEMDPAVMRRIVTEAAEIGLAVKTLPPLTEILRPSVRMSDLRDIDMADLLGRRQVDTEVNTCADGITGTRVLVTGAGGSIGSELCRQIHKLGPAELFLLDRDESALHAVQLSIHGKAQLDSPNVILADIRDAETIRQVFRTRRPDIVFHAAALKHVPMLEQYPQEAWKTNILGTLNVLDAAKLAGVERFVNISTDKAADPVNFLGRSKRIGERLVAEAAAKADGTFLSVRFGNVLGSRGSVLTTFAEQLAAGGPLTVTHPEVTRFLMTIREAVQLVIQAAVIGQPGEALVLDMGTPVQIAELAKALMAISGRRTKIVYTGLGRGEKLHEVLFGEGEQDSRPIHPAISHVGVPPLDPEMVCALGTRLGAAAAMNDLVEPSIDQVSADSPPVPLAAALAEPMGSHAS